MSSTNRGRGGYGGGRGKYNSNYSPSTVVNQVHEEVEEDDGYEYAWYPDGEDGRVEEEEQFHAQNEASVHFLEEDPTGQQEY